MTDRRFHPANPRVAHISLDGQVDPGLRLTSGETRRFTHPVTDLCRAPDGARDKQMLFGQGFQLLEDRDGWAFGFDPVDTYVGYVPSDTLGPALAPTHRISQRSTHVYTAADIKSADRRPLSFLSEISVTSETKDFVELADGGFVPKHHVQPLSWRTDDAASMAEMFLGTPYLWGGNSAWGIDCSGLVQLALYASGRACPARQRYPGQSLARPDNASSTWGSCVLERACGHDG